MSKKQLTQKINGFQASQLTYAMTKLGIADLLYEKKNALTSFPKPLLDALLSLQLLKIENDLYSLTEEGALLARQHPESMASLALYKGSPWIWSAWGALLEALENNKSAFELANHQDLFSYLADHPESLKVYQEAMAYYEGHASKNLLDKIDFSLFTQVIDIGGGLGGFLKNLIEKHQHLQGLVFDRPEVIQLASCKELKFQSGSFFDAIPPGGDLYILRSILHDWCDEKALKILKNIRAVLKPKAKLFIFETILTPTSMQGKMANLNLWITTPGGKIRSLEELETLLKEANIELEAVHQGTSSKSLLCCE